jgi:hypothetical protein
MRVRAAWAGSALMVLVLPLWATAAAQQRVGTDAQSAARAAIGDCERSIDGQPTGMTELEKRCPQLGPALQAAQLTALIIDSSKERLDQQSLAQLQKLLHAARGPAPAVSALTPILRSAEIGTTTSRTWWQRLWDWLLDRLSAKRQQDAGNSWFDAMVRTLAGAQWLWKAIIWGTFIALPIAVIVIVIREVRAMGGRSSDDPKRLEAAQWVGLTQSQLAVLRRMPLAQRPAQLFALLIARLVAADRLPPDRSLTHREVVRRALLDDAEQHRFIESLAQLSERQLYAGAATTPDGIEELLSRGEDLYIVGWGPPAGH